MWAIYLSTQAKKKKKKKVIEQMTLDKLYHDSHT